jgi:SAM-dependent methyltransferase
VEVQEYSSVPYHEHRHREVPACPLRTHRVAGYTRQGYKGSQTSSTKLHNVSIGNEKLEGGEQLPQLPEEAFRRTDETPDEEFYRSPRIVTHIDEGAIAAVTRLYRELFPAGGEILDLMSSWVSHLPPEVAYRRVIGLGMNEVELRCNERLDAYVIQNLNTHPAQPFGEAEFDGAGICVSIDYLTRPVEVLRDVGRVLKVGAPLVITFSNRCFPTKAVEIWHRLDDRGRMRLVETYLQEAGNFEGIRSLDRSPRCMFSDPLYAVVGESTGTL